MSQSGLNRLDVGARQDQLRGVGAAQVVEPGAFDSGPLDGGEKTRFLQLA